MTHDAGFTLWFTGMSGAGKSTLAAAIRDELRARGHRVEVLDGDEVRQLLSKGLTYSRDDRNTNIRRIGFVARLLSRNGVVAIAAAISPYKDLRDEVRRQHEAPFVEILADCTFDELIRRDVKGLYAKALRGEIEHMTGVSDPYERPECPEIAVHTDREDVAQSLATILGWLADHDLIAGAQTAVKR
jgi:adenylyl-sulfate kinase